MLGTINLEVTSFIDSDLTWKGSKGKRSSLRRAKKSVSRSLKDCGKLVNQYSKTVDMPVSESEKLGVSVLGCRFSEKAEHVPIKKRRFVYRSPSPPPRAPSPHSEKTETEGLLKIEPRVIDRAASTNDLGQIVDNVSDVDETNLQRIKGQVDENEDFSGISILAAAACSKDFGGEDGHAEDNSGVEEPFVRDGPFEGSTNNQACSLSKEVTKNDISFAEISTKGTGSCISALPAEELAARLRTVNSSANSLSHRNDIEDTSVQDHTVSSKDLLSDRDEEKVRKQGLSSRDDRLHWDLNTSMDSWEQPFDYKVADSETNAADDIAEEVDHGDHSDKVQNLEGCEVQSEPVDSKIDAEKELPPSNSREMLHDTKQSNIEEHTSDVSANSDIANYVPENMLSSELHNAVKVDHLKGKEPVHSQERITADAASVDFLPADDAKRISAAVNEDNNKTDPSVSIGCVGSKGALSSQGVDSLDLCADKNLPSKLNCDTSGCVADAGMLISSGSQVDKQELAPLVASSINTAAEVGDVLNKAVDNAKEISGSLDDAKAAIHIDDANAVMDMDTSETGQPPKTESLDSALENFACSPLGVEMPTSGASIEAQPALAADLKVSVSLHDITDTDTSVHNNGKEPAADLREKSAEMLQAPSVHTFNDASCRSNHDDLVNSPDRMVLEPLDNGYYSDVSHDHAHVKSSELVDYDSQYEDGEVRESIVHTWEEYDGEDMEAEHVDYGSDNANHLGSEAEKTTKHRQETNFQPSLSGSSGSGKERPLKGKDRRNEVESGDEAVPDKVTGDAGVVTSIDDTKKPSLSADSSVNISGWDHRNFSDALTGVRDGSSRKNVTDDCMDAIETEGTDARMVRSREFRRELPSHIEGRAPHDAYLKDDKTFTQGRSDADNTNPRSERERGHVESFARGRYNQHTHARGMGSDHWVNFADTHRGLKRYRSPNYHGSTSFHRPGPENGSIGRQKIDASSLGVHRRLTRSGSPVDKDEAFRLRLAFRPSRELSPGRRVTLGRGRSVRYGPRVDGRGLRGRYHGPVPDDCSEPSLNHSHPSAKRERSFSPIERRGEDSAHKSLSKSPSRSRTRFPVSGNPNLRHRSKSPNFRSEVRIQRGRSPHPRPGFLVDRMVGFRTMHRSQGSPPHHSRWISDCKGGVAHLREQGFSQRSSVLDRRSPGRFGPRDDRFDLVDSPRNYRSMNSGRFSEMGGIGRGRLRCEGSDDNRDKQSYRFGQVPPAKRYDMDGVLKQFRSNVDDGFVKGRNSRYGDAADFHGRGSPKEFNRGIESRIGDAPRRFREERGPFIYQRDGKYNINSKSFGLRENDDEIGFRRRAS